MAKLIWRVKLVADLETGMISETEVARIERDDCAVPETIGLTLAEGKQLRQPCRHRLSACRWLRWGSGSDGMPHRFAFARAISEIVTRRMLKKQQMRCNRRTVQPFLNARGAVLDGTLENLFRKLCPDFRQANDPACIAAAA